MTAVRVGTRGFMYRYKVPLSELQWVDTRVRFRWTMRKIYGNGMGRGKDPFSNVQRTASVEFLFTLLTPAHFVLVRHSSFEPSSYSSKPCFLGERLTRFSSPSVHSNRIIVFFFLHRLYIFIYRKTRGNERTRSSDRGEKLGNFEDPIETCQPLIPPLKEKLLFHPVAGDELHWNSACNRSRDEDVYIYIYIYTRLWYVTRREGGGRSSSSQSSKKFRQVTGCKFHHIQPRLRNFLRENFSSATR